MPKMKTHSGAAARFKVTGSGRLRRGQQMRGHNFEKKSSARKRRLSNEVEVSPSDRKKVRRLIGI
jgi:large subunit ribosomal protein L35